MIVYTLGPDENGPIEADLIELRPDRTELKSFSKPYLLTNQPPKEGASFCDIAFGQPLGALKEAFPQIQWIYSFHGPFISFEETLNLIKKMDQQQPDLIKCCFDSISLCDYLNLYPIFQLYPDRLILFARGESNQATRLLSYLWGARWIYTSKDGLYGQIPLQELLDVYQIRRLNKQTELYGLIKGKASPPSMGFKIYNPLFNKEGINALYLNLVLEENELEEVLRSPFFRGFSITMPFKEKAFRFCENLSFCARLCESVNTYFLGVGYNTDIEILKKFSFTGKKVAILGGGGVARAYANFLKNCCDVHLFVRCNTKQIKIQKEIGVRAFLLKDWVCEYDVLIDTLPITGLNLPIKKETIVIDAKVFHDRTYENQENFISGRDVFLAQGNSQMKIFFKKDFCLYKKFTMC